MRSQSGADIKRVRLAIEFAEETGLAIGEPRDDRRPFRPGVEYVEGTDSHALAAARATIGDYQFDHSVASGMRSASKGVETAGDQVPREVGRLSGRILANMHAPTLRARESAAACVHRAVATP